MRLESKLLAAKALLFIERHPEHWNQKYYHKEDTHCFAGIVQMLWLGLDPTLPFPENLPPQATEKMYLWSQQTKTKCPWAQIEPQYLAAQMAKDLLQIEPGVAASFFNSSVSLATLRKLVDTMID